jgi:hypothetical protein
MALAIAGGASAQEPSLLLRKDAVELTVLGNYTDWAAPGTGNPNGMSGASVALGFDAGVGDRSQFGVALGLPLYPGASFGSLVVGGLFGLGPGVAGRVDAGVERLGVNYSLTDGDHHPSFFVGTGPYFRARISPDVEFVWGRSGVARTFRFTNVDPGGGVGGYYLGGTGPGEVAIGADTLLASTSEAGYAVDLNIPLGIALRLGPRLSLTIEGGYSVMLFEPYQRNASGVAYQYVPLGAEAVFSPQKGVDLGVNLLLEGFVAASGADAPSNPPGWLDRRTMLLWVRFRKG